jgi:hypothetical protein
MTTVLEEICQRFLKAVGELKLPETKEEYWSTDLEYQRRVGRFFSENPLMKRVMFWLSAEDLHFDERLAPAHERASCFTKELLVRGQELGTVRKDFPLEMIERLIHAIGKVLATDIIRKDAAVLPGDEEMRCRVEKFMSMVHDLNKRILTPEEVCNV